MASTCPECASPVESTGDTRLSELLECPGCSSELEVIGLQPLVLALAPEPDEDWGE